MLQRCSFLAVFSVAGRPDVKEADLERREEEGEKTLRMEAAVWAHGGPWSLGGTEDRAGEALEVHPKHRRGYAMTEDLERLDPPAMDPKEPDARRAEEEVWFWKRSLETEAEVQVQGGRGRPEAPPKEIQAEAARVLEGWGAEGAASPNLEAAWSAGLPQSLRLLRVPAASSRTPRRFPAPRGTDAPRRPAAAAAGGFQTGRRAERSSPCPGSRPAAATPAPRCPPDPSEGAP